MKAIIFEIKYIHAKIFENFHKFYNGGKTAWSFFKNYDFLFFKAYSVLNIDSAKMVLVGKVFSKV